MHYVKRSNLCITRPLVPVRCLSPVGYIRAVFPFAYVRIARCLLPCSCVCTSQRLSFIAYCSRSLPAAPSPIAYRQCLFPAVRFSTFPNALCLLPAGVSPAASCLQRRVVSTGGVRSGGGPGEGEGVRAAAVAVLQRGGEAAVHQRHVVLLGEPGGAAEDDNDHANEGPSPAKAEQARRIVLII